MRTTASLGKGSMIWEHCKSRLLETNAQDVFPAKEQFVIQRGTTPDNLSWMEQKETSTFNFFNICQRRRDRPRSVNDLLDETSTFKPGHARSRSDVTQADWRVVLKTMPLQQQQQPSLQGPHVTRPSFLLSSPRKVEDALGNTGMFSFLSELLWILVNFSHLSFVNLKGTLLSNIHIGLYSLKLCLLFTSLYPAWSQQSRLLEIFNEKATMLNSLLLILYVRIRIFSHLCIFLWALCDMAYSHQ